MADSDDKNNVNNNQEGTGAKYQGASRINTSSDATLPLDLIAQRIMQGEGEFDESSALPKVNDPTGGDTELSLDEALTVLLNSHGKLLGSFHDLAYKDELELLREVNTSEFTSSQDYKQLYNEKGIMLLKGDSEKVLVGLRTQGIGVKVFPHIDLLSETLLNIRNLVTFPNTSELEFVLLDAPMFDHLLDPITNEAVRQRYIADIQIDTSGGIEAEHVDQLLAQSLLDVIRKNGSDLHLTPSINSLEIFGRAKGSMYLIGSLDFDTGKKLIQHIATNANLDLNGPHEAQDGRYTIGPKLSADYPGLKDISLRLAAIPTAHGIDKLTLRIAKSQQTPYSLHELQLPKYVVEGMREDMKGSKRIIFVTGPTGSGKTTTLYAALNELNTGENHIFTIEDPVEHMTKGFTQHEIDPRTNMTYASVLRAALRHDPDIILIGETRDKETLEVAIHASQSGHLCFTTMHTNDAPQTLSKLMYWGIEPLQLTSSLIGISGQRLVPLYCDSCSHSYVGNEELEKALDPSTITQPIQLYKQNKKGCKKCDYSGIVGRKVVAEYMHISNAIQASIIDGNKNTADYLSLAINEGMQPMILHTMNQVLQGKTGLANLTHLFDKDDIQLHNDALYAMVTKIQ